MEPLQSPQDVKTVLQPTTEAKETILEKRREVKNILSGEDKRLLIILGPCSIDDESAAIEYATKIKETQENIKDKILLVMRTYFEKPRTSIGWKGFLNDPEMNNSHHIESGIERARKLLIEINNMGIGTATEFLSPFGYNYIGDLVAYGSIGARTSESQIHREVASNFDIPTGFKNSTQGDISIAINAIFSAKHSHTFMGMNDNKEISIITSAGNHNGHLILRGGKKGPNYDAESVQEAINKLKEAELPTRIIIDCSHANANGQYQNQSKVALNVIEQRKENPFIAGIMVESYLLSGKGKGFGQSRTDGCIDWATTHAMIERIYNSL